MSKICIAVLTQNTNCDSECIQKRATNIAVANNFGVFFSLQYEEPFLSSYNIPHQIVSFADSFEYDNCEMLLLPNHAVFNGKTNDTSLIERLQKICLVLNELSQFGNVELFVGDSGTSYSEFVEKNICLNEFASIACKLLEENGCDIHFIISEHNNSKYV